MNQNKETECVVEDPVTSKDAARSIIVGKWTWLKTTYVGRGSGTSTETPATTRKSMVYEFQRDKVIIYEDDVLKEQLFYELKFWGEGTNTVDEQLLVIFTEKVTNIVKANSLLLLDNSGQCLTLVNSYNDVGGDLTFKRIK